MPDNTQELLRARVELSVRRMEAAAASLGLQLVVRFECDGKRVCDVHVDNGSVLCRGARGDGDA
ncbi:MAG: hypothetical protein HS128_03210 [Ideonella sp.]|nr:hypothetical protein [Ideonella sp.]